MKPRPELPAEELRRLYVEEKRSAAKIAKIYGCNIKTILKRLRQIGVKIRSRGTVPLELPEEELVRLYTEEKLGSSEIAKRFGVSYPTILRRLEKRGIERRTRRKRWGK